MTVQGQYTQGQGAEIGGKLMGMGLARGPVGPCVAIVKGVGHGPDQCQQRGLVPLPLSTPWRGAGQGRLTLNPPVAPSPEQSAAGGKM